MHSVIQAEFAEQISRMNLLGKFDGRVNSLGKFDGIYLYLSLKTTPLKYSKHPGIDISR